MRKIITIGIIAIVLMGMIVYGNESADNIKKLIEKYYPEWKGYEITRIGDNYEIKPPKSLLGGDQKPVATVSISGGDYTIERTLEGGEKVYSKFEITEKGGKTKITPYIIERYSDGTRVKDTYSNGIVTKRTITSNDGESTTLNVPDKKTCPACFDDNYKKGEHPYQGMWVVKGTNNVIYDENTGKFYTMDKNKLVECKENCGISEAQKKTIKEGTEAYYDKPITFRGVMNAIASASGYQGVIGFFFDTEDEKNALIDMDSQLYQMLSFSDYMVSKICLMSIEDTGSSNNVAFSLKDGGTASAFVSGEKQEFINYSDPAKPKRFIYKIEYNVNAGQSGENCRIKFYVQLKGDHGNPKIIDETEVSSYKRDDDDMNTSASNYGSNMISKVSPYDYSQVCIIYTEVSALCLDNFGDGDEQCADIKQTGTKDPIDFGDQMYSSLMGG